MVVAVVGLAPKMWSRSRCRVRLLQDGSVGMKMLFPDALIWQSHSCEDLFDAPAQESKLRADFRLKGMRLSGLKNANAKHRVF